MVTFHVSKRCEKCGLPIEFERSDTEEKFPTSCDCPGKGKDEWDIY